MSNLYYEAGERRAEKVGDLFAAVARRYDLINDLQSLWLHRAWKRTLVRLARITPDTRALDVCCGTGDVAFRLADAGAIVTGVDFSQPMLDVALDRRSRSPGSSKTNPEFLRADAMQLPFANESFEVVTISYGLRNLASWEKGLDELWRVLKPSGRLLVLDFAKPPNPVWRSIYFTYLRLFVPIFGRLFCGNADTHAYILESLTHYPAQEGVHRHLRKLGAGDAVIHLILGGVMSINVATKPASLPAAS